MKIAKVVIAQGNSASVPSFVGLLKPLGCEIRVASKGNDVLDYMKNGSPPDLLLIDAAVEDPSAVDICRHIKAHPSFSAVPVLMVVANGHAAERQSLLDAGCDDILVQPLDSFVLQARVTSLLRLKFIADDRDDAETVLYTLARTIEAKDRYTLGHADRVAGFAVELGRVLGVSLMELDVLRKGGMLHDLGKIAIPDAILTKPGKYTPEEFEVMKQHPLLGCQICHKLRSMQDALPLIRHHHERLDGSGYPDKLKGDQISPLVRVISVVDIYDALRSKRSYKEAFPLDKTFEIMWDEVNKGWWDGNVLRAWERHVRERVVDDFAA
jgi:putative two-component system response regulator